MLGVRVWIRANLFLTGTTVKTASVLLSWCARYNSRVWVWIRAKLFLTGITVKTASVRRMIFSNPTTTYLPTHRVS